jgi:hypothetical protein
VGASELETAYKNWSKRVAQYTQLGIPAAAYTSIAQADMNKVATNQGGALTNEQAAAAVYAAASKQNPLQSTQAQGQRHRGGILGGLEDFVGNVGSDVGHIITGAPAGVAHLATSLVTPGGLKHDWHDIQKAGHDISAGDYGKALRDAAAVPAIDLIPGVADLAAATTPAGREQLLTHPVSSALDVLPITKPLTAGVGVSLAAKAGSDTLTEALGQASNWDKIRGRVDVRNQQPAALSAAKAAGDPAAAARAAGDPSALAALVAGRPVQAGLRAFDRKALDQLGTKLGDAAGAGGRLAEHMARAGERGLGPGQLAIRQAGETTGLGRGARGAVTAVERKLNQVNEEFRTANKALFDHLGIIADRAGLSINPEAERAVYQAIVSGDPAARDALDQQGKLLVDRYNVYRADEEAKNVARGVGVQTSRGYYAAESKMVRRIGQMENSIKRQTKLEGQLAARQAEEKAAQDDFNAKMGAANVSARQLGPRPVPITRAWAREAIPPSMVHARQPEVDAVEAARNRLAKATAAVRGHQGRLARQQEIVLKRKEAYQRGLLTESPRQLHPKIREILRPKLIAAAEGSIDTRRAELTRAGDAATLDAVNTAITRMYTTPIMDDFVHIVGKKEYEALLTDSIHQAMDMERQGLIHPAYVPTVYEHDLRRVMSPHRLAQDRDLLESQNRKAIFTLQEPMMAVAAAVTKEQAEFFLRKGMQEVWDTHFKPLGMPLSAIRKTYEAAAQRLDAAGKRDPRVNINETVNRLMERDYKRFEFDKFGIKQRATGGQQHLGDVYLPRDVVDSFESLMGVKGKAAATADKAFQSTPYAAGMRIFRFSVLYGPRHFAHVVVGGLVSTMLTDPTAIRHFPKLFPVFMDMSKGRPLTMTEIDGMPIHPAIVTSHFDARHDWAHKALQTKVGSRYGDLLKDYWAKMHLPTGERLAAVENAAQSIYQLAVQLSAVKKGLDPLMALEKARQTVVNMEGFSPFERTVLKQVMPFYSFMRYAVRFLWNLPFEHPLRVSILSSMSNQATEEWGTGLPQTMMTLFFFGQPDAKGNVMSVNLRNANPFRSVASMFTWGGFFSSLNPAITAPLTAAGFNPLSGSGQLYPELAYDPTSGTLKAKKSSAGLLAGAEQVVPELGGLDALFGLSDNYRYLAKNDKQGLERQIMNDFNIPFQVSQYNLPQVRGKVAVNTLRAATQAVTAFKKGGRFADTIGKFTLIPYNGQLIPPEQFDQYWSGLKARYGTAPNIPAPASVTANPMANIAQYYAAQPAQGQ